MSDARENIWVAKLAEKSNAVHLVRGLLGCACPPAVFDHYQVQRLDSGVIPVVQLIMGDRLLLWVVDLTRVQRVMEEATNLLEQGLRERERRGLNRFRLCIVGECSRELSGGLMRLPDSFDSKVHLHILPSLENALPQPRGGDNTPEEKHPQRDCC